MYFNQDSTMTGIRETSSPSMSPVSNSINVIGLVLAGGLSTRMGQDKSLLRRTDTNQTLLSHAQGLLTSAGVGTVLVSGKKPEQIHDIYPDSGPLAGIHAALRYLVEQHTERSDDDAQQVSGLLVLPVDMPNITPSTLNLLISQATQGDAIVHFAGFNLPVYIPYKANLLTYIECVLREDKSLSLLNMFVKNQTNAIAVPGDIHPNEFVNINSPEQWLELNQGIVKGSLS
tara:strand:+ start:126 stop:815 length:690 start_codon:yes stop_codon:yes gene_type:complete